MGSEIRLLLVIAAFSQFSGMRLACSADPSLPLAKQLLDFTATGSAAVEGLQAPDLAAGSDGAIEIRLSLPESRGSSPSPTRGAMYDGAGRERLE